ncbi:hypothetical protein IWZ03DRAFT_218051 [Phyllosticta citriasiana]|uniref:Uncharacterized protein n=1 Tax=Phyllosticta citriasiana TaxID=595635 RepID=A0ABR1KIR0_9PEZI
MKANGILRPHRLDLAVPSMAHLLSCQRLSPRQGVETPKQARRFVSHFSFLPWTGIQQPLHGTPPPPLSASTAMCVVISPHSNPLSHQANQPPRDPTAAPSPTLLWRSAASSLPCLHVTKQAGKRPTNQPTNQPTRRAKKQQALRERSTTTAFLLPLPRLTVGPVCFSHACTHGDMSSYGGNPPLRSGRLVSSCCRAHVSFFRAPISLRGVSYRMAWHGIAMRRRASERAGGRRVSVSVGLAHVSSAHPRGVEP